MSDIELVIKIDERDYELMKARICKSSSDFIILNGTPLPKGHGRLIDISEYEKYFNTEITYDDGNHIHSVYANTISTIIEADKENEE